ncbi:MAG: amidohydrolase family protein [Gammaproteobacteria bacterium]|nr:amidohydrolase family protein [Gammaproteobacteria bacterium]
MGLLSEDDRARLAPAESSMFAAPVPTRPVSSDEFVPGPQTAKQRELEARIKRYGAELAARQGLGRREFLRTAAGFAAAFVAMNETYAPVYAATAAEASTPELADERARRFATQPIIDVHTHFLRDDTRLTGFVRAREAVGKAGWNPDLAGKPQTLEDLKFENYFREVFLDSDTKIALISGAPSEVPQDWFLTNEMKAEARARINREAGSRRCMTHAIFTPGMPGWLDDVDHAIERLRPDSFKGYTIGDNVHKDLSRHPWRMDDEKLLYPFYERLEKAGIKNVCVHKGLFPPSVEEKFPHLLPYCDVRDVGRAAKDWPRLNFVIYHSAYRYGGASRAPDAWAAFERSGRVEWVNDLAEIPERYGVDNVYGDLGQIFAQTTMAEPRLCAAMLGILVRGLGADHVVWGTDAVWTGSPQWQIEALRRLEIPEDMQRRYGYSPLGTADGPVKSAIFSGNSMRMYGITEDDLAALASDRFAETRAAYEREGGSRSNLAYGYVLRDEI